MRHTKAFFRKILNTFYNPAFYQEVSEQPVSTAAWFFVRVQALLFAVVAVFLLAVGIPALITFSNSNFVENNYPEGLVITIEDGTASTNVPVPFYVPSRTKDADEPQNLIVIDTTPDLSLDSIAAHDSYVVLTETAVVVTDSKGDTRILSLKDMGDFSITEENAVEWENMLINLLFLLILPGALVVVVTATGFTLLFYLLVSFFNALVPYVVAKIMKIPLTYKNSYRIALYAAVPIIIFDAFCMVVLQILSLPFLAALAILASVVVYNLLGWKSIPKPNTTFQENTLTSESSNEVAGQKDHAV